MLSEVVVVMVDDIVSSKLVAIDEILNMVVTAETAIKLRVKSI